MPALSPAQLHQRRERVFLVLAGLFLGTLAMLNILGVTRFLNLAFFIEGSEQWRYKLAIAVGVLPYPITFLCTDFISELFGRK
ncbi:MAG: VUT family protein, partial [Planctomycetota bacterium]